MAGKQLAKTWPSKSMAEQREFLREVIARTVVGQTGLQIDVVQSSLQGALLGGQPDRLSKSAQNIFTITIDAQIKRCGWEVRIVVPSDSGTRTPSPTCAASNQGCRPRSSLAGTDDARGIPKPTGNSKVSGSGSALRRSHPSIRVPRSRHCRCDPRRTPARRSYCPEIAAWSVAKLGRTAEAARVYACTLLEHLAWAVGLGEHLCLDISILQGAASTLCCVRVRAVAILRR